MNCSIAQVAEMLQVSMNKQMDELGVDDIIAEKKHLPDCPKQTCNGKLSPNTETQLFACDCCNSKFKLK
jgi:ribosomal protein L37AE/L43A